MHGTHTNAMFITLQLLGGLMMFYFRVKPGQSYKLQGKRDWNVFPFVTTDLCTLRAYFGVYTQHKTSMESGQLSHTRMCKQKA